MQSQARRLSYWEMTGAFSCSRFQDRFVRLMPKHTAAWAWRPESKREEQGYAAKMDDFCFSVVLRIDYISRSLTRSLGRRPARCEAGIDHYVGNRPPLEPSPFVKLPVGAVRPEGWVRRILELQAEGLVYCPFCGAPLPDTERRRVAEENYNDEEAEEVAQALHGYKGIGQMTLQCRFYPATLRAKQMIAEGFLGKVISFRAV